ncbi:MAG: cytochrome C [Chloroflexi bacterium]|nr:cytochrome C [Chloroflexota bacterium]
MTAPPNLPVGTLRGLLAIRGTDAVRRVPVLPVGRFLFVLAALLLAISVFLPYWSLTLHAPQYPGGLDAVVFTTRLAGDIDEIDELNHYIGMMRLDDAGRLERRLAPLGLVLLAGLALAAGLLRPRLASLLALPLVAFPFIFLLDLYYWLHRAGHELDPRAPLSSSIHPFTPTIVGVGRVGQFSTTATLDLGFDLALLAALMAVIGIVLRLRQPAE